MKKNLFGKLLFCLTLICIFHIANAQRYIGIKGGISIPNLKSSASDNPVSSGWSSREGPYFGIVGSMRITRGIGLQAELNYSSQGGKKDGAQAIPTSQFINPVPMGVPKYLYANYKSEAKLNYLELPVMLKFSFPFAKIFSFFIQGGPYGGYLLSAKNINKGSSRVYFDKELTMPAPDPFPQYPLPFDTTVDIKDQLNKFNFGIQGGIGFSMKLPGGMLLLTGGGNYGLSIIQKNEADGKDHTGAATVTLGYLFKL